MAKRVVLRAQKSWFNATEKSCCFRKCIAPVSRREDFSSACFPLKDWAHSAPIYSKQLHLLLLALLCLLVVACFCRPVACRCLLLSVSSAAVQFLPSTARLQTSSLVQTVVAELSFLMLLLLSKPEILSCYFAASACAQPAPAKGTSRHVTGV